VRARARERERERERKREREREGEERKKHATHQCLGGALVLQARNIQLQSQ